MDILPAVVENSNPLAISPAFLNSLETRSDYENAFTMVSEQKNQCTWLEADLILNYYKKFLGQHLDVYKAGQLLSDSTIKYYLRTASGFPAETRLPSVSFNHHYMATYADQWDSKTLGFKGDKRFTYIHRASDEGMSTRKLKEEIDQDQKELAKEEDKRECYYQCSNLGTPKPPLFDYVIYRKGSPKADPLKITAHEDCFNNRILL
jgi:hypothetical protein